MFTAKKHEITPFEAARILKESFEGMTYQEVWMMAIGKFLAGFGWGLLWAEWFNPARRKRLAFAILGLAFLTQVPFLMRSILKVK